MKTIALAALAAGGLFIASRAKAAAPAADSTSAPASDNGIASALSSFANSISGALSGVTNAVAPASSVSTVPTSTVHDNSTVIAAASTTATPDWAGIYNSYTSGNIAQTNKLLQQGGVTQSGAVSHYNLTAGDLQAALGSGVTFA